MKVNADMLYDRYLTAFTCAATGSIAHSISSGFGGAANLAVSDAGFPHDEAAEIEAAQALGTLDGLICRANPQTGVGVIRQKRSLLDTIAHLLNPG